MNVLDLFSGIGGFSLGLGRAGFRTVAFCESDDYCRRVLGKHWPDVPIYADVATLTAARLAADGIIAAAAADADGDALWHQSGRRGGPGRAGAPVARSHGEKRVDLICGGFPCQDLSVAGRGAGLDGERSGLWLEFARIIGEVRPRYVLVENVAALLGRGLGRVLGDLAALGFDCEWHCIPACAIGAPHRRDRIWIVAHAGGGHSPHRNGESGRSTGEAWWLEPAGLGCAVADADGGRCAQLRQPQFAGIEGAPRSQSDGRGGALCDADRPRLPIRQIVTREALAEFAAASGADWWGTEPPVGRMAHAIPNRVDRLKALGNAVVPGLVEVIGRAIMESSKGGGAIGERRHS